MGRLGGGRLGVSQTRLMESADNSRASMKDLFKSHPAWNTLIVRNRSPRDVYRLDLPPRRPPG
jgi:hypothetical protein